MARLDDPNERVAYLRSNVIGALVEDCARVFVENEDGILSGKMQGSLVEKTEPVLQRSIRRLLRKSVGENLQAPEVVDIEIAGNRIITYLMRCLVEAVMHPERTSRASCSRRCRSNTTRVPTRSTDASKAALDHISGVTDVYALDLFRKLNGHSLPGCMKTIRLMKTKTIILFILLALCLNPAAAQDFPKNPNIADARSFVADPANMLSPETKAEVNRRLHGFRQGTSAEMAVAVVPEIGGMSIEEYSTELFRQWGLGKADNDNGILLVISTGAGKARIETGYGVEGAMPDAVASRIIQKDVVANTKTGNLDAAVNSATAGVVRVLSDSGIRRRAAKPSARKCVRSESTGQRRDNAVPVDNRRHRFRLRPVPVRLRPSRRAQEKQFRQVAEHGPSTYRYIGYAPSPPAERHWHSPFRPFGSKAITAGNP